jgi:acetyl/propionyl-CoA carboxylase alpha subunit
MKQALAEFKIGGLRTNLALLGRIMRDPEFVSGTYDTGLLARMPAPDAGEERTRMAVIAAALLAHRKKERAERPSSSGGGAAVDYWKLAGRPGAGRLP